MGLWRKIGDLLYPKGLTCNACGKELFDPERKYALCKECAAKVFDAGGRYFGERYRREIPIDGGEKLVVRACFRYEFFVRDYVIDYKDADKTYLCHYMALHLSELYTRLGVRADAVTYVPTSPKNRKRRGYDGMRIVAREFGETVGLPLRDDLFRLDGVDQSKVAPENRKNNVKNVFLCRNQQTGAVLLLDDVSTTGATVEECARSLLSHGAAKVVVLTFALAGDRKDVVSDEAEDTPR